jgi:hypothetical protein
LQPERVILALGTRVLEVFVFERILPALNKMASLVDGPAPPDGSVDATARPV